MGTPAQALKHRGDNKLYRLQVSAQSNGSQTETTLQGSKVERNSCYFHNMHWLTFFLAYFCLTSAVSLKIFCLFSRPHDKTANLTVCEEKTL